ncbi:MAG: AAA family ATPase [Candidatus Hadarchaeales archaeon]
MLITISGEHGAGKSVVAKELARRLGLRYLSAGEVFRRMAEERGMDLKEFSEYAEKHPEIDREIDRRLAEVRGEAVVDGRLSGWMVKDADLRVLLTAPLEVRVRRIAEREGRDLKEVREETLVRERSERKRFKELYGIDIDDLSVFDLVINTSRLGVEEEVEMLERLVERRRKDGSRKGVR